ncbi:bifunctional DNA primase/polymerase [Kitasatospora sp. NPDC002551]|uniref:bifunctional DNA primase/polymerase n=1 Tax=Kitasatospora sp. NPDC002551 TaxID=3154539 RepID=UPI00331AAA90
MPAAEQTRGLAAVTFPRGHEVARWCAVQGWPVHPLAFGRKTPAGNCRVCRESRDDPQHCPCIAQGRYCHGFHAATTDMELVDRWWGQEPGLGVGVACGPAGLVVIDIDAHAPEVPDRSVLLPGIRIPDHIALDGLASGYDTLALLAAYRRNSDPAKDTSTLRVRTPSGGLHIWYRTDTAFRCSTGSSSRTALAWQVDVRAHGGYIVAPGTQTRVGAYTPLAGASLPAPLPVWIADELTRTGHRLDTDHDTQPEPILGSRPRRPSPKVAGRLLQPLLAEVTDCSRVAQGAGFTEKLNRAAFTAGGLIAAGHLDLAEGTQLLREAALAARPGRSRRIDALITSSLAAGARRPLHIEGRRR